MSSDCAGLTLVYIDRSRKGRKKGLDRLERKAQKGEKKDSRRRGAQYFSIQAIRHFRAPRKSLKRDGNIPENAMVNITQLNATWSPQDTITQHNDPVWFSIVQNVVYPILGVMIIGGNALVLYCLATIKRMHTITGMFLMNLAITDIGVGIISIPVTLVSTNNPGLVYKQWFCDINGISMVLFLLASLLTLTALSIQKYLTVGYQMHSRFTKKVAYKVLAIIWFISFIFALGPVVGWSYYATSKDGHQCGPFAWTVSGRIYSALIFVVGMVIPILAMTYCYVRLYLKIHSHLSRMKVGAVLSASELANRHATLKESSMVQTLIIMGVVFITCWSPSAILVVLEFAKVEEPLEFEVFALMFAYANSTMNPFIYALRHKEFRRGFKNTFWRIIRSFTGDHSYGRYSTSSESKPRHNNDDRPPGNIQSNTPS